MFAARLWTSNNFRLAVLWIWIGIHFLIQISLFGFREPRTEFASFSERQQKYYNYYFHGRFETDREKAGWFAGLVNWVRKNSLKVWVLEVIVGVIYFFIAMREEVGRAYRLARERTRAYRDLPAEQQAGQKETQTGTRSQTWRQAWIFVREFFASIVAELLGERMVRA
ncbi:MAG: hypothetical protein AAB642_03705 [Patescibacteria group bacterium]